MNFASIKSALSAEIFPSVHRTAAFTSAVRALNSIDESAMKPCKNHHRIPEHDFVVRQRTYYLEHTPVSTILNLALVTIFVIAVDVAYSQLSNSRISRALRDSFAHLSDKWKRSSRVKRER